jgi:hypothetical protein
VIQLTLEETQVTSKATTAQREQDGFVFTWKKTGGSPVYSTGLKKIIPWGENPPKSVICGLRE